MNVFSNEYTIDTWKNEGREYYKTLIAKEEYGRMPKECTLPLRYEVLERKENEKLIAEKIGMFYNDFQMTFYLYTPNNGKKKFDCIETSIHPYDELTEDYLNDYNALGETVPIEYLIDEGYMVSLLILNSVAVDDRYTLKSGIFNGMGKNRRYPDSWGTLAAWAYAMNKVTDYIVELENVNKDRICLLGHSRGAKAAIYASVLDERYKLTVLNASGCLGASLTRGKLGQSAADIKRAFGYWVSREYYKYADNEDEMPFDQHILLALIAPRYVYVSGATNDEWNDPDSEILSCRLATQYFDMYGVKGLVAPAIIKNDVSYDKGSIGYHVRSGEYGITIEDYKKYISYFRKIK